MTQPASPPVPGEKLTPRQILTAMSGLVVAMLLAQLDNMIVAPALPTIVGDLGGLEHLAWVVTGYILASTIATPICGSRATMRPPAASTRLASWLSKLVLLAVTT